MTMSTKEIPGAPRLFVLKTDVAGKTRHHAIFYLACESYIFRLREWLTRSRDEYHVWKSTNIRVKVEETYDEKEHPSKPESPIPTKCPSSSSPSPSASPPSAFYSLQVPTMATISSTAIWTRPTLSPSLPSFTGGVCAIERSRYRRWQDRGGAYVGGIQGGDQQEDSR